MSLPPSCCVGVLSADGLVYIHSIRLTQVNGIFELALKNKEGKTESWIIDMKKVSIV